LSGSTLTIATSVDHGIEIYSTVVNGGTINVTSSGDLGVNMLDAGIFTNTGALNITGSTNHNIQIDANANGAPSTLTNSGTITLTNGSQDGIRIKDDGILTNSSGAIAINTPTGDGIRMETACVVNNSAAITITGAGAGVAPGDKGLEMSAGTFNNLSGSTLTISNTFTKGIVLDAGTINNTGTIDLSNTGEEGFDVNAGTAFNNNNGGLLKAIDCVTDNLQLDGGTITNDGDMQLSFTTDGSGRDDIEFNTGTFTNTANATFNPGAAGAYGEFELRGSFSLGSSKVTFDIGGTSHTTQYDRIQTVDASTITLTTATMHINWGSFIPSVGNKFMVITGSSTVTGTFATVTTSNANITHQINYTATGVEIEVTAVLPVEMTYFKGSQTVEGNLLEWATATEENNSGFEIQRSIDSKNWETIAFVEGNGTSLEVNNYEYLDVNIASNSNYYRLKQIDLNGAFEFSKIVVIQNENQKSVTWKAYPNPVYSQLTIEGFQGVVTIYNLLGQPLKTIKIQNDVEQISFSDLEDGQYLIEMMGTNGTKTIQRIIKVAH
jgi:hypothetical protein